MSPREEMQEWREELQAMVSDLAPSDALNYERDAVLARLRDDVAYRCLFGWMRDRLKSLEAKG